MSIEQPPSALPDTPDLPKTPGEKFYDVLQFTVGKAMIIVVTAALAYTARYGKDSYRGVPNYLKKFQNWFHERLITHAVEPLNGSGEQARRAAAAAANTMIICHGGNAFAPVMKWMENSREEIANWYNRRWGTPEDIALTHERLKDTPKQSWGDIIKGRTIAWGAIFGSFLAVDAAVGKDKKTGMYHFDKYEEWFGRKMAGLTKAGKELAAAPMSKALSTAQAGNKLYRFGKIVALDFYATSAAIVVWNFISRSSAKKRHEQNGYAKTEQEKSTPPAEPAQGKSFSDAMARHKNFAAMTADKSQAVAHSL